MKNITDLLIERLKLTKDTIVSQKTLTEISNSIEYTKDEPKENQEDYIQVSMSGRTWKDTRDPIYIKVEDLGGAHAENEVLTIIYNLMKKIDPKMTTADIQVWETEDGGGWRGFAAATLQTKNRMWHPEWIKSNNYPFT